MSVIAESLKKSKQAKEKKKFKVDIYISETSYYNIFFILGISIFIGIFLFFLANFFVFKKKENIIYNVDVKSLLTKYNKALTDFKSKEKLNENYLRYLIKSNNLNLLKIKLKQLQKEDQNLFYKFSGILDFKENNFQKAKKELEVYCSSKLDDEAISYLSKIYYLEGNIKEAILLINKMQNNNFTKFYNIAVIFEESGKSNIALKFYKKAYTLVKDPLLKRKLYNKIFIIEHYE